MRRWDVRSCEGDDRNRRCLLRKPRGKGWLVDELGARLGRVVRAARARACALRGGREERDIGAEDAREIVDGDGARAQHGRARAGEVEDGRLEADLARTAVEDRKVVDGGKLGRDVGGGSRRDATASVCARRRERSPEGLDQRARDGVRGRAHGDRGASANARGADVAAAREDDRKRPGPEGVSELLRTDVPADDGALRHGGVKDMRDERVRGGTLLEAIDLGDRGFAGRVAGEPVDGLSGEGHGVPAPQALGALRNRSGIWLHDHGHARTVTQTREATANATRTAAHGTRARAHSKGGAKLRISVPISVHVPCTARAGARRVGLAMGYAEKPARRRIGRTAARVPGTCTARASQCQAQHGTCRAAAFGVTSTSGSGRSRDRSNMSGGCSAPDSWRAALRAGQLIGPKCMKTFRASDDFATIPAVIWLGHEENSAALTTPCGGAGVPSQGERCKARRSDDKAQAKEERDLSKQEDVGAHSCLWSYIAFGVSHELRIKPAGGYGATEFAKPGREVQRDCRADEYQPQQAQSRRARSDALETRSYDLSGLRSAACRLGCDDLRRGKAECLLVSPRTTEEADSDAHER